MQARPLPPSPTTHTSAVVVPLSEGDAAISETSQTEGCVRSTSRKSRGRARSRSGC